MLSGCGLGVLHPESDPLEGLGMAPLSVHRPCKAYVGCTWPMHVHKMPLDPQLGEVVGV